MQEYTKVDEQLHVLTQIIAKINRSFVAKRADDGHTNLVFDGLGDKIYGRWISAKNQQLIFSLNLENQCIEIQNESKEVLKRFVTIAKHIEEIEQEIKDFLPKINLDANLFSEPMHYQIPRYDVADKPLEKLDKAALAIWKHFRLLANNACLQILGFTQKWTEIRIWPHHFDTGVYIGEQKNNGIGFGLAMQDSMVNKPYFYLTSYPFKENNHYKNLPQSKYWHWQLTDYWKGAVLELEKLQNCNDAEQVKIIGDFISENLNWNLRVNE